MYEGQVVFKPIPFNNDRFKKRNDYLVEVILEEEDKYICLYYISNKIRVDNEGNLEFFDEKANFNFSEKDDKTEINVYDSYDIELVSTDYDVYKTHRELVSISRYIIYANRKALPVIKLVYRRRFNIEWGYQYQSVRKKGNNNE